MLFTLMLSRPILLGKSYGRRVFAKLLGFVQLIKSRGGIMPHRDYATKNKQQKHPKINFRQYLYNSGEPRFDIFRGSSNELSIDLLEDSYDMKRRFRQIARKMRDRVS